MQLNLPILEQLTGQQHILIAGTGGGFDVFIGLPLYFSLRALGKTVHLANYSFCDADLVKYAGDPQVLIDDLLLGTCGSVKQMLPYFPEGYLSQWFKETRQEDVPIWMFMRSGPADLKKAYLKLIEHLGRIDALILVDGGVDSLMRGDESDPGTMLEDSISLAAAETLDIPVKILACLGFGTEIGDGLCHAHALENMAALAKEGAFLGSCALTAAMEAYQFYESALRYVWEQPEHLKSHISTQVVAAVRGESGNHHLYEDDFSRSVRIAVSPLMSLYWFFEAGAVIRRNLMIPAISSTRLKEETFRALALQRRQLTIRKHRPLPY
jgi:hypothetical protein